MKITDKMIDAGAEALDDGSDMSNYLSPTFARYYAERVLVAAFKARAEELALAPNASIFIDLELSPAMAEKLTKIGRERGWKSE